MDSIKRAVVTGAGGFIGQPLIRKLLSLDIETIAIDCQAPIAGLPVESYDVDIREVGALERFLTKETVLFHLAAEANVPKSVKNPRGDFEVNLAGFFEVLESARKSDCRVIFPSTGSVFDSDNTLPIDEKAFVRPSSPYGASKAAGEAYCAAYYRSYGLDVRIARLFSVYGEGMRRFAIHDLTRKMEQNSDEISILGDGSQIRDYLYIDDVIDGLLLIADRGVPGESYNLASGESTTILDLARAIAAQVGCPDITLKPTGVMQEGEVPMWYADITKIKKIGFEPKISLSKGLQQTIRWLKANL